MGDKERQNAVPRVERIDANLAKHAYGEALTRIARLAAYAEAGQTKIGSFEIGEKQTQLAIDDLVHMAISLRRLAEATGIYDQLSDLSIPVVSVGGPLDAPELKIVERHRLDRVINKLIHGRRIEVLNYTYEMIKIGDIAKAMSLPWRVSDTGSRPYA